MSYCRFSSMDLTCQLYIYESSSGFNIHVAFSKYIQDIPKLPNYDDDAGAWHREYKVQMECAEKADLEPIGLPHDGDSFCSLSVEKAKVILENLKQDGYIFPYEIIDIIGKGVA